MSGALKDEKFRWNDTKSLKGTNLKITPGIEMVIPIIIFSEWFCELPTDQKTKFKFWELIRMKYSMENVG